MSSQPLDIDELIFLLFFATPSLGVQRGSLSLVKMFSKPECSKTPRIFQAIVEPFVCLFQPAFTVVKRAFAMYLQKSTMSDEIEALSYRGFNEIPLDNYSRSNFKNSI